MNLFLALGVMLGVWAGYRLGTWWAKRSLEQVVEQHLAKRGFAPSEEFLALLRRPTVDGVARKIIRKMGLCAYADILLGGVPITMVCHDKALLQRAVSSITARKDDIEADMVFALMGEKRAVEQKEPVAGDPFTAEDRGISKAPMIPNPPPPPAPGQLRVIDGGKK